MDKKLRELLEQATIADLVKLNFVKADKHMEVSPRGQEVLNEWIAKYNHLLKEKYYHQYWHKVLWEERSYRLAKEHRELAERYHLLAIGMADALECTSYYLALDGWIEGEGRFKNTDFPVFEICNKDIPF